MQTQKTQQTPEKTQEPGAVAPEQKLFQLYDTLTGLFIARERESLAVIAGLLSGEPVLLIGPPGTAKTALVESLSRLVNARYYYHLLHEYVEPEELIGPVDIIALRRGEYRRNIEGYIPTSEIIFLDEVFRSSGAVRNLLLDIILRRQVRIGNQIIKLPTLAIYAASNFISREDVDSAFVDRFTIRAFVKYVPENNLEQLIRAGLSLITYNNIEPILNVNEVRLLQQRVIAIAQNISQQRLRKYVDALIRLSQRGVAISDRRKIKVVIVAAAIAMVYGATEITLDDLADALRLSVVNENEMQVIEDVLTDVNMSEIGNLEALQTLLNEVKNAVNEIKNKGIENMTVNDIRRLRELVEVLKQEKAKIRQTPRVKALISRINQLINEAINLITV